MANSTGRLQEKWIRIPKARDNDIRKSLIRIRLERLKQW